MSFLERILVLLPDRHDGTHVDFVEGGQHGGLLLDCDKTFRYPLAQHRHFLSAFLSAAGLPRRGRCCGHRISFGDPSSGSTAIHLGGLHAFFPKNLVGCGRRDACCSGFSRFSGRGWCRNRCNCRSSFGFRLRFGGGSCYGRIDGTNDLSDRNGLAFRYQDPDLTGGFGIQRQGRLV